MFLKNISLLFIFSCYFKWVLINFWGLNFFVNLVSSPPLPPPFFFQFFLFLLFLVFFKFKFKFFFVIFENLFKKIVGFFLFSFGFFNIVFGFVILIILFVSIFHVCGKW